MLSFKKIFFSYALFIEIIIGAQNTCYSFYFDTTSLYYYDGLITRVVQGPWLKFVKEDLRDMQSIPEILKQHPEIRALCFGNYDDEKHSFIYPFPQISPEVLSSILQLKHLTRLTFNHVDLTINGHLLTRLPATLKTLQFDHCIFPPELLAQLPKIKNLKLCGSEITHQHLASLPKTLKKLSLCSCPTIVDGDLWELPIGLSSLKISLCEGLTKNCLSSLPQGLKKLSLTAGVWQILITDGEILKLPPQLVFLSIKRRNILSGERFGDVYAPATIQQGITDRGLAYLPENLTMLEIYDSCQNITDAGLRYLKGKIKLLRLYRAEQITEEGLAAALSENGMLDLIDTKQINATNLRELHPTLKFIQSKKGRY